MKKYFLAFAIFSGLLLGFQFVLADVIPSNASCSPLPLHCTDAQLDVCVGYTTAINCSIALTWLENQFQFWAELAAYGVTIGIPVYSCPNGYTLSGTSCVSNPPTASIVIPVSNISVTQNQAVAFSGTGTASGGSPAGVMTTYNVGGTVAPSHIAFDGTNMWVSSNINGFRVAKITSIGATTPYLSTTNGALPVGIAFDGMNMWVAGYVNDTVTKVSPSGVMTDYFGTGAGPWGIAFDGVNMWTVNDGYDSWLNDYGPSSVTKISPTGVMTTYYGLGFLSEGIAFDGTNMWTTSGGNSVTKISPAGVMTTYPGTGASYTNIAFDGTNMWATSYGNNSVTKISPAGVMTTYPGTGSNPTGIAFDGTNMWTANYGNNSVTRISPTGVMTTYSGVGANPGNIAFDGINMWTANVGNNTVTKVSTGGNSITAYEWREGDCTTGTLLSTASSFNLPTPTVSAGRTIYLRVKDSLGTWSTNCPSRVVMVTPANTAPVAPTVSGPITTNVNIAQNYTFTATDAEGDQIRYGIDWDMDNVADEWLPAGVSYVNSGTPQSTLHSWTTPGGKTFQALAQDAPGVNSTWTSYTVTVPTPVNGACGSSHLSAFSTTPSTNLCTTGNASAVAGLPTGPWTWSCNGVSGGTNASCNAFTNVVAGSCGSANGTPVPTKPTTNLCSTGNASSVTGPGPWNWNCNGLNGGSNAPCSAPKSSSCGDSVCQVTESILTCPIDCKAKVREF